MILGPNQAYLCDPVRTPFGKLNGSFASTRPDDLLAGVFMYLKEKIGNRFDITQIEDVIVGDSNGAGDDNRNVARMSLLLADIPSSIPGVTVNRLCGSGAEAIAQASRLIKTGEASCLIAGGVESMSRAPWIVEKEVEVPAEPKLHQSTVGWRLVNPLFPPHWTASLGRCSEEVAERFNISRQAQDEWAYRSHQLAAAAWYKNLHDGFVVPFGDVTKDESIRADGTLEKLASLPSVFSENGAGTAGNSSPLNDGSVAMLITDRAGTDNLGLTGIGRILGAQVTATSPNEFTLAPITAIHKVLARTGKKFSDIKVWEINEAFASMVLTVLHEVPEIDLAKVNINGGAIAIGHPVGASAARVVVDCARELKRQGGGIGIAAACIGVGLGVAIVVEVKG